ncbi:MAG: Universal stress protein family [uncultured Rubrobacteraceae bacterium]|uniref:Universal stress protein family n=1 Tax=uncultured Rubrobacteraceae bacterium TaxID=349277 RepID=A0A6J4R9M9_9ACTN|nr:MAG: Universal stress protein family [uncultured Rubrobacteraceae bacterium]
MNVFPTRILLASDGSESAAHATEVVVELSKKTNSELHVLYVGEYSTAPFVPQAADPAWVVQENLAPLEEQRQQFEQVARQTLDAEVQQVREVGGTVTQAHLRIGTPAAEIVKLAEELEVGLIVVGSRGLGGIRRTLIGSVADSVVRHAHCLVLVVRKEEEPAQVASGT